MDSTWRGGILLDDQTTLEGLSISPSQDILPAHATLKFLSVVQTSRIPLFLASSNPRIVSLSIQQTETWFSTILLSESQDGPDGAQDWWKTARTDSPLGILVAIEGGHATERPASSLRTTELLLYSTRDLHQDGARPPTPPESSPPLQPISKQQQSTLSLLALPLCSDLLNQHDLDTPSPPLTPDAGETQPQFLPPFSARVQYLDEPINIPPVRKRKPANDTLDQAALRRQKPRKETIGASDIFAEPRPAAGDVSQKAHRRSVSITQPVHLQSRPLSRASSVSSIRAGLAREPSQLTATKRSSLARVESVPTIPDLAQDISTEQKNKDLVSKIVLAGMRMYGLVQSKSRKSRSGSTAASPCLDISFEEHQKERESDEEFKLIYHQVYKGMCFALRQHIAVTALQPHANALRETADRLLSIYCNDPLIVEDERLKDELTPGGRKAFGSSSIAASDRRNPFLVPQQLGSDSKSNTPCDR